MAILETLTDAGRNSKDTFQLVDAVRQRLGASICQAIAGDQTSINVISLHPEVERQFREGLAASGDGKTATRRRSIQG